MISLSSDSDKILNKLKKEKIDNFYHFTSVENLPGIIEHNGLCSKHLLESEGDWPCPKPGGNVLSHNLDRLNDNWDKIGLNLTPHTPMFYIKKKEDHYFFFEIFSNIASLGGVIFTDTNATHNEHNRGEGLDGINLINFNMIRSGIKPYDIEWKKYVQAEVLIPKKIPFDYIRKIIFVSEASMKLAEYIVGNAYHPPFIVDHTIFQDYPNPSSGLVGFSNISKVILTNIKITEKNVKNVTNHMILFKKTEIITAIISLEALAGTKGIATWRPINISQEESFLTTDSWIWWISIDASNLPVGKNHLEIYINNIQWAVVMFEVIP